MEECWEATQEARVQALSELAGPQHLDDTGILKSNSSDKQATVELTQPQKKQKAADEWRLNKYLEKPLSMKVEGDLDLRLLQWV